MSYDLFTFRCPPGADPSEYATDVIESFDEEVPEEHLAHHEAAVLELIAAYREEFPDLDLADHEQTTAMLLIDEQVISVDVFATHTDICVSYGVPKGGDWLIDRLERLGRAAARAGHDTLFDAQLDRPIHPHADRAELTDHYGAGLAMVAELQAEHDREASGGFFKRLFRRG